MKSVFRLTHPPDQRHNERLWPHVTVSRDSQNRIETFRFGSQKIPIANADPGALFPDGPPRAAENEGGQASRGAAHLIACGPSIAKIDYTALRPSRALGVNGAIALSHSQGVRFDYYCITDAGFIRGRPEMVADIVSRDLLLFTTPLCLWYILQYIPAASLVCRIFVIERVGRPTHRSRVPYDQAVAACADCMTLSDVKFGVGFSEDIRKGIFPGGTVAFEGLQILTWLGFDTIHIHGVDLSDASKQPRFYETQASMLPTTLDLSLWTEIEPSFRHASGILRERGITVRNLSSVSALGEDIFKKIDWRDLLSGA